MHYNTFFQQLFNFIPRHRFEKAVKISGENRHCKHFTAWKQFLQALEGTNPNLKDRSRFAASLWRRAGRSRMVTPVFYSG
jgi:hypothetical protein